MSSPRDALRRQARQRRDALSTDERHRRSAQICAHIENLLDEEATEGLASYSPVRTEVDVGPFNASWSGHLYLPRTESDGHMEMIEILPDTLFESGSYGIQEPHGRPAELSGIDAVLVPGLAFDEVGGRLGYGAGYYDRFLERLFAAREVRPLLVGVAFGVQCVDVVPVEPHDVPLDVIINEAGLVWTPASGR